KGFGVGPALARDVQVTGVVPEAVSLGVAPRQGRLQHFVAPGERRSGRDGEERPEGAATTWTILHVGFSLSVGFALRDDSYADNARIGCPSLMRCGRCR